LQERKKESKPGLEAFFSSGNETNNLAEKKKILDVPSSLI